MPIRARIFAHTHYRGIVGLVAGWFSDSIVQSNWVYAPYVEHVPPDVTACIFWLTQPTCPSCGKILRLTRITSRSDGRADLRTYGCQVCGFWVTEAAVDPLGHHRRTADALSKNETGHSSF